jgi:DNA-binding SARP family transcriptional activator
VTSSRYRILGPLRVRDGDGWSAIRAAQQRVVLAVLLIEAGRVVGSDRLIHEIWGVEPPAAALVTVQGYVRRLRRLLGDGRSGPLLTRGRGYELVVDDGEVDAAVFDGLVDHGLGCRAGGMPDRAAAELSQALALWRGPALGDVPAGATVTAEAARLERRRLTTEEERLDALLDLGRHADVAAELRELVRAQPLRERLRGLQMLALHRCGRPAEALAAYDEARRVLVTELGVEPGTELRRLRERILVHGRSPGIPAQLPADVAHFTGRRAQLARLDALLPGDGPLAIRTIAGTAGVGKTALAVHWAHRVRARFPDGQLYVNMRGYGVGRALRPIDALTHFLSALGVPAEKVPREVDAAAGLYRTLLNGKRVLVLIDNAGHPAQVRPLLPGTGGCLVLVTSRDQLRGLVALDGAVRLDLDILSEDEANRLLVRLIGTAPDEAELVAELARLCGRLPLALRIVAANRAAHPRRPLADLVAELAEGDRLSALAVTGDPRSAVRGAFDQSYVLLPAAVRRLFRLQGLAPVADITVPAAAALAGSTPAEAAELLDALAAAYLVERRPPGRYAMHDLIRRYAIELAGEQDVEPDRRAALARLYNHYLYGVAAAAGLLHPFTASLPLPPVPAHGMTFHDEPTALAWLDAERTNLVAVARHAAEHGPPQLAWRLADALRGQLCMNTAEWAAVIRAGLSAAEADGDPLGRAAVTISVAMLHTARDAIGCYTRALALSQRAGWSDGESMAIGGLGTVYHSLGRLAEAADHHERALAINRRTGFLLGQAAQLADLGWVYHRLGRTTDARTCLDEALTAHRELGDRATEGTTTRKLAELHRDAGVYDRALDLAGAALSIANTGCCDETQALIVLAGIHCHLGHADQAVDGHRRALTLARDLENPYLEAAALVGLAEAEPADRAALYARAAHAIARDQGYRLLEARALVWLAASALRQDHVGRTIALASRAMTIDAETGHRLGHARASLVLAHALHTEGDEQAARSHANRANTTFIELGTVPAEQARLLLGPAAEGGGLV